MVQPDGSQRMYGRRFAAILRGWVSTTVRLVAAILLAITTAQAGDMTPAGPGATGAPAILDNKVFTGEIGAVGKPAHAEDSWIFEHGTFMSKECEKCGFPRGVYRTERKGEKITFVTETPCPRTDARIVWRGTVENGRIEGVFTWTKKRWYRTIRKDFWFRGKLDPSQQAAAP